MNRFVLPESIKHILSEKYFLNEKYILDEASERAITVLNNWFTKITDELDKLQTKLNEIKNANNASGNAVSLEADLNAVEEASKAVELSRQSPDGADEELKKDLNTWYQAVKTLLGKLSSYNNSVYDRNTAAENNQKLEPINADLVKLEKNISTGPFNKAEALGIFDELFKSIKDTFSKQLSTTNKFSADKIEKLGTTCDNALNNINIFKNYFKLDYNILEDNEISSCIDALRILSDDIAKVLELPSKINFKDIDKNMLKYVGLISSCAKTFEEYAELPEVAKVRANAEEANAKKDGNAKAAERAASQAQHWEARYKACKTPEDFDKFWDDYFEIEWKDKADAVRAFGILFIEDCEKNGFDAINNTIIKFLKTPVIYELLGNKFNLAAYTAIHNALANGYLSSRDLKAGESSTFGTSNIIFNPELYNNITLATDYIRVQAKLANTGLGGSLEVALQQIWKQGQGGHIKILNNLILADGDGDEFSKDIDAAGKALALRPIDEAKQILEQITGSALDDKSEATNTDLSGILDNINSESYAKGILAYLVDYCTFNNLTTAVNKADEKLKEDGGAGIYAAYQQTPRPTRKTAEEYSKVLRLETLEFKQPQMIELLSQIAQKAGLAVTKGS